MVSMFSPFLFTLVEIKTKMFDNFLFHTSLYYIFPFFFSRTKYFKIKQNQKIYDSVSHFFSEYKEYKSILSDFVTSF